MTFTIGLIGGIGSGKTTVSDRFAELGIVIADADVASRTVVEPGQPALALIAEHFGSTILSADGSLNRAALRSIIFSDHTERRWLEQLTHPLIIQECYRILNEAESPYAILVLSTGTGKSPLIQRLLVVDAPAELQVQRTMSRDQNSEEQVKAIIASQLDREERNQLADDIIVNDGELVQLTAQVNELHKKYLSMASDHQT